MTQETQLTQEDVETGEHGLIYLTDPDNAGVFIAAKTLDEALWQADQARIALVTPSMRIDLHTLNNHPNGKRITVPDPEWMTPDQRAETIGRLRSHLKTRMLS